MRNAPPTCSARAITRISTSRRLIQPGELLLLCTDGCTIVDDKSILHCWTADDDGTDGGGAGARGARAWQPTTSRRWSALRSETAVAETQRSCGPNASAGHGVVDRIAAGTGIVYSAHDDLMGRDVAIKVMMTDPRRAGDSRASCARRRSRKAAHRNIVTVFDVGEDNGRLFIVMELAKTLGRMPQAADAFGRGEGQPRSKCATARGGERGGRLSPRRQAG